MLILLQFIEWQLIIASENTVFIYHLNKFALSTRNKDKEKKGQRDNVSACLWKKIERLNRLKITRSCEFPRTGKSWQKEVECAESDQIALSALGSSWSPASLLPPPNSATYQPPWSFVLISHSMSTSWSQSFLFTHLTQCKDENPTMCTEPYLIWPWLLLTPIFYHCSHYLRPTNIYPSASSLHVQYSSSAHSCDSSFLLPICPFKWPHLFKWPL